MADAYDEMNVAFDSAMCIFVHVQSAFYQATALTDVDMPSVTSIGDVRTPTPRYATSAVSHTWLVGRGCIDALRGARGSCYTMRLLWLCGGGQGAVMCGCHFCHDVRGV